MRSEKQRLESEIAELEKKHKTFQDRVIATSEQRRSLQKSLANEKKIRADTVRDMVDFEALNDTSAKGFVDKILQSKLGGGSTHQLQTNIDKLIASEEHCRKRQREISKDIAGIKKQIRKLDESEALKACYKSYEDWYNSVLSNEEKWFSFKDAVKKCHSYQMDYQMAFKENDIKDDVFFDVMASKLRSGVVAFKTQAELIRALSTMTQIRPNKWYVEPGKLNERHGHPRKLIDRRRDNYKP